MRIERLKDGANYRGRKCKRRSLEIHCDTPGCGRQFVAKDIHEARERAVNLGWRMGTHGGDLCGLCLYDETKRAGLAQPLTQRELFE